MIPGDISSAEIERRYQEAIAVIKAQRPYRIEDAVTWVRSSLPTGGFVKGDLPTDTEMRRVRGDAAAWTRKGGLPPKRRQVSRVCGCGRAVQARKTRCGRCIGQRRRMKRATQAA